MQRGYIKLFRKLLDNPLWKEKRKFSKLECWIDILFAVRSSEEPEEIFFGFQKLICNQGESLYSISTWAERWNMTKSSAKRVLNLFQDCNMIELKDERKTTRLKVLKFCEYRDWRNANETQTKRKRNANETHLDPNNTDNTDNIENPVNLEAKASCPEPEKSAPNRKQKKPKITFNFETKKFEGIEESDIEFWKDSFPAVEIIPELKKIAAWLVSNPTKKKANYPRFITNWFSKTQDKGGNVGGYATAKAAKKPTRPMMTEKEQNSCPHFFEFLQKKITLAEVTRRTGKFFPDDQYLRCDGRPYSDQPDGEVIEIEPERKESGLSKNFGLLDLNGEMPF